MRTYISKSIYLFLGLLLFTCQKKTAHRSSSDPRNYQNYISAYSSSNLKITEPIKIIFTQACVSSEKLNEAVDANLFSISPKLKGQAKWENDFTFSFLPDPSEPVRSMEYNFEMNLKKLFPDIVDSLSNFSFTFQYVPIHVEMDWDFPRPDHNDKNSMMLEGHVRLNDRMEDVSAIIKAVNANGENLKVDIKELDGLENEYFISIHKIPRLTQESKLDIEWLVNPDSQASKLNRTFIIPSTSQFIVTGIKEDPNDNKCLMIYFSDFLDQVQELKGLIQINLDSVKTTLVAEKDIIHVSFDSDQFRSGNLTVSELVKNDMGRSLSSRFTHYFDFMEEKPKLRLLASGNILASSGKVIFPFQAINLKKVDVEIFKVFSNNVLYNMHLNEYNGGYMLNKLGRVVHQQTIDLVNINEEQNKTKWVDYGLDISKMVNTDPGAMYDVRILFRPQYSDYNCPGKKLHTSAKINEVNHETGELVSIWKEYGYLSEEFYDGEEEGQNPNANTDSEPCYDYDNPCCVSYYSSENFIERGVLVSNLALMVKGTGKQADALVMAYDVMSAKPLAGVNITTYDKQLQALNTIKTDASGICKLSDGNKLGYVVAIHNNNYAYLHIDEAKSLSNSEFDLNGVSSQNGLKASIYTDRGIWRPGDTIHYNVILNQRDKELPENFPIDLELSNPKGIIVYRQKLLKNTIGLYSFKIPTMTNWLTGRYESKLICGSSIFNKSLSVETVKPNRMKTEWKIDENENGQIENAEVIATFLHGAPASNKKITVDVYVSEEEKTFSKYKNFNFSNPRHKNLSDKFELTNTVTNSKGSAEVITDPLNELEANALINCTFETRIMDEGGDISTDYFNKQIDINDEYVGIKMPETPYPNYYSSNNVNGIELICLDKKGNPLSGKELEVQVYITNWDWWYEFRANNGYYSDNHIDNLFQSKKLKTDSRGKAIFDLKVERFQNYYIQVSHGQAQQQAGAFFYTGWNSSNGERKEFVQTMNLSPDKENYQIGEKAIIHLPGSKSGTYVVHLVRDNRIIKTEVVSPKLPSTDFTFAITEEMFPNIYVDATLIQGMSNKENDLPLRLYGVTPVMVSNEKLRLQPIIKMDDKVRPDNVFNVEISESKSNEMAYQLMIVDDGLLNLTRFKTPDPYKDMFSKEAMLLMTWDNYDQFIGNEVKGLSRIFSIGGDQQLSAEEIAKRDRFKPVVYVSGPQFLRKGEKKQHQIILSNYIGSVRVMVVANNLKSFGSADKSVFVRNEIAAQMTLPRVASVNDKIFVPITVFKYEEEVKSANISLKVNGPCEIVGSNSKSIDFGSLKEKTIWFELKTKGDIGTTNVECNAVSGNFKSNAQISLYIDNPNPVTTISKSLTIEPGASMNLEIPEYGVDKLRSVKLEFSLLGLSRSEEFLQRLIQYPHGCIEQTTSAAFPQLYLADFINVSEDQLKLLKNNVSSAIKKLGSFQQSDGGMAYWPGSYSRDEYCSAYALHFLSEARKKGYQVPDQLFAKLIKYVSKTSNSYTEDNRNRDEKYSDFIQAYRLYVLSSAGEPEWGAMNRLRLKSPFALMTKWMLAGAYASSGKVEMAKQIQSNLSSVLPPQDWNDNYYGSDIRDEAFIAMVLYDMGDKEQAGSVISDAVKKLNNDPYPNTQELSSVMSVLGKIYKSSNTNNNKISCNYKWNDQQESISSHFYSIQKSVVSKKNNSFSVNNTSDKPLTVSIVQSGKLESSVKIDKSNGIKLMVRYYNKSNKPIDISSLMQGEALTASITVSNVGNYGNLKNLALTAVFPAGLEIVNSRIGGIDNRQNEIEFEEYRDDRVMFYFDLQKSRSVEIEIPLIAAYAGNFLAPMIACEDMYRPEIYAHLRNGSTKILVK